MYPNYQKKGELKIRTRHSLQGLMYLQILTTCGVANYPEGNSISHVPAIQRSTCSNTQ